MVYKGGRTRRMYRCASTKFYKTKCL